MTTYMYQRINAAFVAELSLQCNMYNLTFANPVQCLTKLPIWV